MAKSRKVRVYKRDGRGRFSATNTLKARAKEALARPAPALTKAQRAKVDRRFAKRNESRAIIREYDAKKLLAKPTSAVQANYDHTIGYHRNALKAAGARPAARRGRVVRVDTPAPATVKIRAPRPKPSPLGKMPLTTRNRATRAIPKRTVESLFRQNDMHLRKTYNSLRMKEEQLAVRGDFKATDAVAKRRRRIKQNMVALAGTSIISPQWQRPASAGKMTPDQRAAGLAKMKADIAAHNAWMNGQAAKNAKANDAVIAKRAAETAALQTARNKRATPAAAPAPARKPRPKINTAGVAARVQNPLPKVKVRRARPLLNLNAIPIRARKDPMRAGADLPYDKRQRATIKRQLGDLQLGMRNARHDHQNIVLHKSIRVRAAGDMSDYRRQADALKRKLRVLDSMAESNKTRKPKTRKIKIRR